MKIDMSSSKLFVNEKKQEEDLDISIEDFIITVFWLIDDQIKVIFSKQKIRRRGPSLSLHDSEVLTMEITGEFLGKDNDKAI